MAKTHLFTSESVTMGHPDKVSDMISDGVLDALLAADPNARVACETLVTTGLVVLAGEVTVHTDAGEKVLANIDKIARGVIKRIGYTHPGIGFDYSSCAVLNSLHGQSADISQGVTEGKGEHVEQGAGDQGLMFGFACDETSTLMPMPIYLSHRMTEKLTDVREDKSLAWVLPDGKTQVTVEYHDDKPARIHTVVISTQHTEEVCENDGKGDMTEEAKQSLIDQVAKPVIMAECPELWNDGIVFHINPTGRFVVGGPHGDSGLTGRKIIVDTYGGRGSHGGGAFSGKDPSKVDRSASYMARHVAKNIVAAGLATACEVQLAYAIGVADPLSVLVDCEGTETIEEAKIAEAVLKVFPLTPKGIGEHLDLKRPIYQESAHDGHFGRELDQFNWEKCDHVDDLKAALGL
jgi:S-adenosylmethionine synthetase